MKSMQDRKWINLTIGLFLSAAFFLGGCTNLNPVTPVDPTPSPTTPAAPTTPPSPTKPVNDLKDIKVVYNYNDNEKVQLSANNLMLKVGQKLILEPAPGLTQNTRFTSSGEYFFGDILKQETGGPETGKAIFTAIAPGKGKLTIIPNTTEIKRASELWVTVQ
ncbi:hypothetical protein [Pelosinus propionicus]|uniref:Uncharacterized protein n=1 Tax=Pelosinus propionicus DSM 13327 TaxID=1123291 RepID=A0A1I4M6X3_9FIRM|nr:hypothetical protein [Pelosinus propionicus]SFL98969.1 hypothetical protein SAMN04490355_103026 [Pelosinus propionicus DSM 13327]